MDNKREKPQKAKKYITTFSIVKNKQSSSCLEIGVTDLENKSKVKRAIMKKAKLAGDIAVCCQQSDASQAPFVYISGGRGQKMCKQLTECDVILGKWRHCAQMNNGREKHCLAAANGKIYALGGVCNDKLVSQIEEYDRKKNSWKVVAYLHWKVHSSTCTVYNGKIYLFGGLDQNGENVSVVQVFDPVSKSASVCAYLPIECSGGRIEKINDTTLLFLSGQGHFLQIDPRNMTVVKQLCQPTNSCNITTFAQDSFLFVTYHGCDKASYKYCLKSNQWYKEDTLSDVDNVLGQCAICVPSDVNFVPFTE